MQGTANDNDKPLEGACAGSRLVFVRARPFFSFLFSLPGLLPLSGFCKERFGSLKTIFSGMRVKDLRGKTVEGWEKFVKDEKARDHMGWLDRGCGRMCQEAI